MFRYEVINQKLEAEGRKRKWFARECQVPLGSMHLYLSGHRQPNAEILGRMAKVLKVSLSKLIEPDPEETEAVEPASEQAG